METVVKNAYNNLNQGFIGAKQLYYKLKEAYPDLTLREVKEAMSQLPEYQLLKEQRRRKYYNSIVAEYPNHNWQIDIIVYSRFELNHYKYILTCVDVYSRYAKAEALTSTDMPTVVKKLQKIMTEIGQPETINCDNQFNNEYFNTFCDGLNIKRFFSEPNDVFHNGIVERFNRTLALGLQRARLGGYKQWYKVLPNVIDSYNDSYHSTTKHTPNEVFNFKHRNEQDIIVVQESLKVGDLVRTATLKQKFDKGDRIKYSTSVYVINSIKGKKYQIRDLKTGTIEPKLYRANELILATEEEHPLVETVVEDIKKEAKEKNIARTLKHDGIKQDNVIDRPKRERKQTVFFRPS